MASVRNDFRQKGTRNHAEMACHGLISEPGAAPRNDPVERLPMKPGGVKNLTEHKWFTDFDWDSLSNQTMAPPYKPVVKSKKDLQNFVARKEDAPRTIEPLGHLVGHPKLVDLVEKWLDA